MKNNLLSRPQDELSLKSLVKYLRLSPQRHHQGHHHPPDEEVLIARDCSKELEGTLLILFETKGPFTRKGFS